MKLFASLVFILSLYFASTIFPKFFIMLDCFILSHVLKTTPFPKLNGTVNAPYSLGSIDYNLHDISVEEVMLEEAWVRGNRLKHGGSRFEMLAVGLVITASASWNYKGKSWVNSVDSGVMRLETKTESLSLAVDLRPVLKSRMANLTLSKCRIKMSSVKVVIHGKHNLVYQQLERHASHRLQELIKSFACKGIEYFIEHKLNALIARLNKLFFGIHINRDGYFVPQILNWTVTIAIFATLTLIGVFGIGFLLLVLATCYINILVLGITFLRRYFATLQKYKNSGKTVSASWFDFSNTKHTFVLPLSRGINTAASICKGGSSVVKSK